MKRVFWKGAAVAAAMTVMGMAIASSTAAHASDVENPDFNYTHLLPSPFTLQAGHFALGTDAAYGLTNWLQVGTNLLADFYKVFNANAKVSLIDREEFASAFTFAWQSFNLDDFDSRAPDRRQTSWMPGVVASYELIEAVAVSAGGNLNFSNQDILTDQVPVSAFFRGAAVETDVSWVYYVGRKGNVNAVAGGVSYDFSYKLVGFGVSHYFKNFKAGIHYYPQANQHKFVPILAGGMVIEM